MSRKHIQIIACETVIKELLPLMPDSIGYQTMEFGLHLRPQKLKVKLQEAVDAAHADCVVLGYGLCSMAVLGLKANRSTLIIPRIHDCIALFLGSQKRFNQELSREPGTYFLSKGWIDAGATLIEELRDCEERYGKRRTEIVKNAMLRHYSRLAFIDTGYEDQGPYREFARRAAEELNLRYEEIKGITTLLRKLINGPWDDGFIVAPPGHEIIFKDFGLGRDEVQEPPGRQTT